MEAKPQPLTSGPGIPLRLVHVSHCFFIHPRTHSDHLSGLQVAASAMIASSAKVVWIWRTSLTTCDVAFFLTRSYDQSSISSPSLRRPSRTKLTPKWDLWVQIPEKPSNEMADQKSQALSDPVKLNCTFGVQALPLPRLPKLSIEIGQICTHFFTFQCKAWHHASGS